MDEKSVKEILLNYLTQENPSHSNINISNLSLQQFEKSNILSDIYFFNLEYIVSGSDENYKMVLKIGLGDDQSTAAVWKSELEVMSKLYDSGYPVPKIFHYGDSLIEGRGAFIIMERIEGKMLSDAINENINELDNIEYLIDSYVNLMVELHNLGWPDNVMNIGRKHEMFTDGNDNPIVTYLNDYLKFTKHIGYHTLSGLVEWLIDQSHNLEVKLELGITHGDFQTDNVLVMDNKKLCVIDWGFGRTADIRMDVHWSYLINSIVHTQEVGGYIYNKYLQQQDRVLKDNTFFEIISITRLLLGLSQLATRSKNYHNNVNRFLNNMDFKYLEERLISITKLNISNLEQDFRSVTGVSL